MLRSVLVLRLAASASSLSVWRLLVSGWVWDMMRARVVPADMSAIFDDVRKGEYFNTWKRMVISKTFTHGHFGFMKVPLNRKPVRIFADKR